MEGVTVLDMHSIVKSRKQGIRKKADVIEHFGKEVKVWADDHILPSVAKSLSNENIMIVRPRPARGESASVISPKHIADMRDFLEK